MRATSFTNFRKNLAAEIDSVNDDHEPVIITREGGKPSEDGLLIAKCRSHY